MYEHTHLYGFGVWLETGDVVMFIQLIKSAVYFNCLWMALWHVLFSGCQTRITKKGASQFVLFI
jgi:hypothetical protein